MRILYLASFLLQHTHTLLVSDFIYRSNTRTFWKIVLTIIIRYVIFKKSFSTGTRCVNQRKNIQTNSLLPPT